MPMKKQTAQKKGMSTGNVVALGATVAALAAATYYFFGPEGKKNRTTAKGWMIKMKGEIVDKLEDAKEVTEAVYHKIVDTVAQKYMKGSKMAGPEVEAFVTMLKRQWKDIAKSVSTKGKQTATKAKKAVKKTVSKVKKEI